MGTLSIPGGILRSRRVPAPRGRAVRPTPGRVKESLFAILASRVEDARVLDLFAGTGSLGFEALSRGARSATFVEADAQTAQRLRAVAAPLGVAARVTVIAAPAERAASRVGAEAFDIVFADPPYAQEPPARALAALRETGAIGDATLLVFEHSSRREAPHFPGFALRRAERYGEVALAFYDAHEQ